MSLSRRVGRNAANQLAGRLFTSTLAFVVTAVLLPRLLGKEEFGIFAFYLTLHQLLVNVLDFGAGTIVIREASRRREEAGRLLGLLVGVKAVLAAAGAAGLIVTAWVFEGPGLRFAVLSLAALPLLFHAPAGAAAIFHVDMEFRWSVLAAAAGQSAWLLGTALLAVFSVSDPAPYVLAYGLGTVVNGSLCYLWARRRVTIRYDAGRAALKRLWTEMWPAGVSMAMASVYFFIDTAMLRPLRGEAETAEYQAAYRLMTFVLMVPVLFSQVIFPVFSRLWAARAPGLLPFFRRSLGLLLALGLVVPATVPLLAADVMALVYPPAYAAGASALVVLCFAVTAVFATYPHLMLLLAAGRQRLMMVISTTAALFNVGANLLLIPRYGILGAAWTTVATEGFVLLAAAACARRTTGVRMAMADLRRPLLCAAGAGIALSALLATLPPVPGLRVATGVAIAALAVLASGVLPLDLGTEEGAPDV